MNYYFGFSIIGLIVFLLAMLPNIFYFIKSAPYASDKGSSKHLILDILEHGCQGIFLFMLIFILRGQDIEIVCPYTIAMSTMLILYYSMWILYFKGIINLKVLMGLAIFPVIYFILAEIWLNNYIAIIPTVIFGIAHVMITYKDYQFEHKIN